MSHRRRRALVAAAGFATLALSQRFSSATTFTWTGATNNDLFNNGNYVGGVAPSTGDVDANNLYAVVHFGTVGVGANTTPDSNGVGYAYIGTAVFDLGAPTYTFGGAGNIIELDSSTDLNRIALVNNSTTTQVLQNFSLLEVTGNFNAAAGNLVINAPVAPASNSGITNRYFGVTGSHDIYFNVDPSINAAGSLTGGAWHTAAIGTAGYSNQRGQFYNSSSAGRVYLGDIGNTYRGTFHLASNLGGKVRLTNNNSLGDPGLNNNDSIVLYGGNSDTDPTAGNSTLELDGSHVAGGGISVGRGALYVDGRTGTANANTPHIENIAGNNTFTVNGSGTGSGWNTGWTGAGALGFANGRANAGNNPGNINFKSDSGTITFAGGPLYNTSPSGSAPWTIQLFGAGNGVFQNQVTNTGGNPGFSLVKNGTGTWTLANANDDYAGTTTVNQGTFKIATGAAHNGGFSYTLNGGSLVVDGNLTTSSVIANPTTVVAGTGTIHADTFISGAAVNPGDGGVGALSVKSLAFDNAANAMNIDLGTSGVDKVTVMDPDGLQFLGGAGSVLINPTSLGSVVNGVYPLVDYNGTALNAGSFSSFSLGTTSVGGLTLALQNNTRATSVDLVVTGGVGLNAQWNVDGDGNWNTAGNWNPNSVPNGQDQIANFGSILTNAHTVTLNSADGAKTVGTMNFSPTGDPSIVYTIAGTGTIIVNSSTGTGTINNISGANVIGTGSLTLQLASNTNVNVNNGTDTLTIGAKVTGTGALNKNGPGTLVLSSSNSFSGGLNLSAGTLQVSDNNQLGATSSSLTFAGGTLLAGTDLTLPASRNLMISAAVGTIDSGTNTVTLGGPVNGTGILEKIGNGTLAFSSNTTLNGLILNGGTLASTGGTALTVNSTGTYNLQSGTVAIALNGTGGANINTGTVVYTGNNGYTGNTTLASGVLIAPTDSSLGGTTSNLVFAGGTLQPTGNLTLGSTRGVILNSSTSIIYNNHVVTINGPISGAGGIVENEAGATLVLAGSNSFTGAGTLTQGILRVTNSNGMTGSLSLPGNGAGTGTLQLANNINYSASITLGARQNADAIMSAIDNLSDNNTISSPIVTATGGGNWNIGSDSGKLTLGAGTTSLAFSWTGGSYRILNLRGAGSIEFAGNIQAPTAGAEIQVNNLGTGNLILSGSDTYHLGNVSVLGGGTITFSPTLGDTETDPARTFIAGGGDAYQLDNNSTLDVSNATGLSVGGVFPLANPIVGGGTVKGNISAVAFDSVNLVGTYIQPGGTESYDPTFGNPSPYGLTPGAGRMTFTNNVDLSNGAIYGWQIATLTTSGAGTNYDQIAIGGTTVLGGTSQLYIDVGLLAPADQPVVDPSVAGTNAFWTTGHQWKIVDITGAGTNSTVFASIAGFANDSGPAYFKQTLGTGADAGDVLLNYAVSIKGDANRDGKVNAIDFNILATNYGTVQQKWSLGDFDGSGTVDSADFTLLSMHFGQTSAAPAPGLGSLVPEPTSLSLLGAAAVLGLRRRRTGK